MEPGSALIIIGVTLLALFIIFVVIVLLRTFSFSTAKKDVSPIPMAEVDGHIVAEHLSKAIQIKTIAHADQTQIDPAPFEKFHSLLQQLYPLVHEKLKREVVNNYSLLYTWLGTNPDLDPILLASHMDVVPADEGKNSTWTHPPFAGVIDEGYLWGRGTLDCKYGVIGILEAVTKLIENGFKPERTIYLGFGHDEEVSGINGAKAIAELLENRQVQLACLIDEGGSVIEGMLTGVDIPSGLIGISEKGFISLKLSTRSDGGHSSMPPANTNIGLLSLAIASLEAEQFPAHLEVITFLMSFFGNHLPFMQRMAFANSWLFGNMLKRKLSQSHTTNAMIRTTTAPTIFKSGDTENVLPTEAEAVINFRIFPGDTLRSVYERVVATIDDERIQVSPLHADTLESDYGWDPTPVADTESDAFKNLSNLIEALFPGAIAVPFLMMGATDARHYHRICPNAFRFSPFRISKDDLKGVHGIDEHISIDNLSRLVAFYMAFMELNAGNEGY